MMKAESIGLFYERIFQKSKKGAKRLFSSFIFYLLFFFFDLYTYSI